MMLNRLLVLGALLVASGIVLLAYGAIGQGNVSAGGFILIGPLPIVFGTGNSGEELAFLSVIVGILMVVLLLKIALRFRNLAHEGDRRTDE
jgi:uncharacterized protein (TIGR00304 family)